MTAIANPHQSSNGSRRGPKTVADAAPVASGGDLGTIQSILLGDFSAQTEARVQQLEQAIATAQAAADERIASLESALATERRQRKAAVTALQNATEELRAAQNKALGQVKADVTRGRKQLRSEIADARAASVDRSDFGAALRSLADVIDQPSAD
jgi:dihydroxyacetone kinase